MSAANEFTKNLGREVADLLGAEFRFYRSTLELRRSRAGGWDVIALSTASKWSPHVSLAFYFGRNFDAVRAIEKKHGEHRAPCHIQQYSLNAHAMKGLGYPSSVSWQVNVGSPPATLAKSVEQTVQRIAFPFFERFTDLVVARDALAADDSWCFGARGAFWRHLFMVDAALDDLDHFRKWGTCLDPFYASQAAELIAKYSVEGTSAA